MPSKWKDAYSPDDPDHVIIKMTSEHKRTEGSFLQLNDTQELFVRVPLAKIEDEATRRKIGKHTQNNLFEVKGDKEQMAQLRKEIGGVPTDVIDEQGNHLPGAVMTKMEKWKEEAPEHDTTVQFLKHGVPNDVVDDNGYHHHAFINTAKDGTITYKHAIDGKPVSVTQPDGTVENAVDKTVLPRNDLLQMFEQEKMRISGVSDRQQVVNYIVKNKMG